MYIHTYTHNNDRRMPLFSYAHEHTYIYPHMKYTYIPVTEKCLTLKQSVLASLQFLKHGHCMYVCIYMYVSMHECVHMRRCMHMC